MWILGVILYCKNARYELVWEGCGWGDGWGGGVVRGVVVVVVVMNQLYPFSYFRHFSEPSTSTHVTWVMRRFKI